MFKEELTKFRFIKELKNATDKLNNDTVPLSHSQATEALGVLSEYSQILKLPSKLIKNANMSYVDILQNGVPLKAKVKKNINLIRRSLKNLVEVLEYERFADVSLEELQSKIQTQNWKNYLFSYGSFVNSSLAAPNSIVMPTKENFPEYLKLVEAYKKMEKSEKEVLHEFETLENCVKQEDIITIYKILRNNDKFLCYVEDGCEMLQTIENYLVYQALKEINYLQKLQMAL